MAILILVIGTLLALVFKDKLNEITNPEHIEEVKFSFLNPETQELINEVTKDIELVIKISEQSSLKQEEKEQMIFLISNAIEKSKKASELEPNNPLVWETRAKVYRTLVGSVEGADEQAILMYEKAIELNPQNAIYNENLGDIYYEKEQYDKALNSYLAANKLAPEKPTLHYKLGLTYKELNQNDEAYKELNLAKKYLENTEIELLLKIETELDNLIEVK